MDLRTDRAGKPDTAKLQIHISGSYTIARIKSAPVVLLELNSFIIKDR